MMKSLFIGVLAVASAAVPAAAQNASAPLWSQLPQAIRDAGVIKVGSYSLAPLNVENEKGQREGLEYDLAAELSKLLGVKFTHEIAGGLAQTLTGMQAGRYDLAFGPWLNAPPNSDRFNVVTWLTARPAFLLPRASTARDVVELCGTTVAAMSGSAPIAKALETLSDYCGKQGRKPLDGVMYANQDATILAVQSQRANSAAMTPYAAAYTIKKEPEKFRVLTTQPEQYPIDYLGLIVQKENTALANAMLAALQQFKKDGAYLKLLEKYELAQFAISDVLLNPCQATPAQQCR